MGLLYLSYLQQKTAFSLLEQSVWSHFDVDINSGYNRRKAGILSTRLNCLCRLLPKRGNKKKKTQQCFHKSGHSWPTHVLRRSGFEPNTRDTEYASFGGRGLRQPSLFTLVIIQFKISAKRRAVYLIKLVIHRAKAFIYANGAYFEFKKLCIFPVCLRFLTQSVLKLWTALCTVHEVTAVPKSGRGAVNFVSRTRLWAVWFIPSRRRATSTSVVETWTWITIFGGDRWVL
jgi:hypothetical protein